MRCRKAWVLPTFDVAMTVDDSTAKQVVLLLATSDEGTWWRAAKKLNLTKDLSYGQRLSLPKIRNLTADLSVVLDLERRHQGSDFLCTCILADKCWSSRLRPSREKITYLTSKIFYVQPCVKQLSLFPSAILGMCHNKINLDPGMLYQSKVDTSVSTACVHTACSSDGEVETVMSAWLRWKKPPIRLESTAGYMLLSLAQKKSGHLSNILRCTRGKNMVAQASILRLISTLPNNSAIHALVSFKR